MMVLWSCIAAGAGVLVLRPLLRRARQAVVPATAGNNVTLARHELEEAVRRHPAARSLVAVGVQRIDRIGDLFGPAAADAVNSELTARIHAVSPPGALIGRSEGHRWLIAIPTGPDQTQIEQFCSALLDRLRTPVAVTDRWTTSLDLRLAILDDPLDDQTRGKVATTVHATLSALTSPGGVVRRLGPTAATDAMERSQLAEEFAIGLERGEVVAHFQPICGLDPAADMVAVEVLARWMHPTRGTVPPGVFLPVMEELQLQHRLTVAMVDEACRAAAALDALPGSRSPGFHVNLSAGELEDPDCATRILDRLTAHGCPADRLVIEITEHALLSASPVTTANLETLRSAGVRLALDDFGTGFATFGAVHSHRFDELKLDGRFIRDLTTNTRSEATVDATVRYAARLGIGVIAECIETDDQLDALRRLGIEVGQGFLLARPVPLAALVMLAQQSDATSATTQASMPQTTVTGDAGTTITPPEIEGLTPSSR